MIFRSTAGFSASAVGTGVAGMAAGAVGTGGGAAFSGLSFAELRLGKLQSGRHDGRRRGGGGARGRGSLSGRLAAQEPVDLGSRHPEDEQRGEDRQPRPSNLDRRFGSPARHGGRRLAHGLLDGRFGRRVPEVHELERRRHASDIDAEVGVASGERARASAPEGGVMWIGATPLDGVASVASRSSPSTFARVSHRFGRA